MSDLIIRCSSIGRLMARPDAANLDPALVDDEVKAILAKTKRSEVEKSILEDIQNKSLSAGGKTHVRELVREAIYWFEPARVETRPMLKGIRVEAECIEMLARLTGRPLVKNTVRKSNWIIAGEADVFDPELRRGWDVKAAYSMQTMPIAIEDCYDSNYEWQMRGYSMLWDADAWSVDYMLVDTPDDLIGFDPPSIHYVSHINERLRWSSWVIERDRGLESLIADKVLAARRYYMQVMNEFDHAHSS